MKRNREPIDDMIDAHVWIRRRAESMTTMYAYETWTIDAGGYVPSGRYGTPEAVGKLPGSRIIDLPPVEVESKDFCPFMDGLARQGYRP